MCGVTLFLASSMCKKFYLRQCSEDGSCPAVTHSGLTEAEMRAMKYRLSVPRVGWISNALRATSLNPITIHEVFFRVLLGKRAE
jgi:hypothetical protein